MATSSITHNFVIRDVEEVNKFVNALELAERDKANRNNKIKNSLPVRELSNPTEIRNLMAKRRKRNV